MRANSARKRGGSITTGDPPAKPRLIFTSSERRTSTAIELPWLGSLEATAKQISVFDQVLPLFEGIGRNRLSPTDAAALVTGLLASNPEDARTLIQEFSDANPMLPKPKGRPHKPIDQTTKAFRGKQIDETMVILEPGFRVMQESKLKSGRETDDAQARASLRAMNYNPTQTDAILHGRTLQDAAIKYFYTTHKKTENIELASLRNDYSSYKKSQDRPS